MGLTLAIRCEELDPPTLQSLTRDLCRAIGRETDIQAELTQVRAVPGVRGDLMSIGSIFLTLLSSGTAVALVKVLESYIIRGRSLEFEFSRPDGQRLILKAQDLDPKQMALTQQVLERMMRSE